MIYHTDWNVILRGEPQDCDRYKRLHAENIRFSKWDNLPLLCESLRESLCESLCDPGWFISAQLPAALPARWPRHDTTLHALLN